MQDSTGTATSAKPIRRWWPLVKWILFAVVMYFIVQRAVALWRSSPPTDLRVHVGWLVPAAALYLVAWIPSIWFWRALLKRLGQRPPLFASVRAYYIGHLGKYVPGKALVLVIRGALLKESGTNSVLAALTAAYETLVAMATGATIAVALAPAVIPDSIWQRLPDGLQFLRQQPLLVPLLAVGAAVAGTPFSAWLFTRIGRNAVPLVEPAPAITAKLVLRGLFITALGWILQAFSLGCTLQSVSNSPLDLARFPVWLASVSLSTFAGFLILVAPGGLGVREWILVEILKEQPELGNDRAIVVAGLLRLVWFASELVAAGVLYLIRPRARQA